MPSKQENTEHQLYEGMLDRLDRRLGRFSDADGAEGKRRRSFGATVFFWLCIPMVFLVATTGLSQVIVAISGKSSVPRSLVKVYERCLKEAKNKRICKMPVASKGSSSKINLGSWPWLGCGLLVLIGFFCQLMRRKQDYDRFNKTAEVISVFATKKERIPSDLLSTFKGLSEKMIGTLPKTEPDSEKTTKKEDIDPLEGH
jgi:hypothetical protein